MSRTKFNRECPHCGVSFETIYPTKLYCSERCSTNAKKKRSLLRVREYLLNYKTNNPCVECGETRLECLQFHHLDPSKKVFELSKYKGLATTIKEIEKCIVLCANCHLHLHHILRQGYE